MRTLTVLLVLVATLSTPTTTLEAFTHEVATARAVARDLGADRWNIPVEIRLEAPASGERGGLAVLYPERAVIYVLPTHDMAAGGRIWLVHELTHVLVSMDHGDDFLAAHKEIFDRLYG